MSPDQLRVGMRVSVLNQPVDVVDFGQWPQMKQKYPAAVPRALETLPSGLTEDKLGRTWALKDNNGTVFLVGSAGVKLFVNEWRGKNKDLVPGGLADAKRPEDFDPEQLATGVKVELEHTDDENVAREIAMDHLTEDAEYYVKLREVESKDIRVGSTCPHCGSTNTHGARTVERHPDGRWGFANAACSDCDNGFSVDTKTGKVETLDDHPERDRSKKKLNYVKSMDQSRVIAIDLNGTLASGKGADPEAWGEPQPDASWAMQQLKDRGYVLCINSVVGDEDAIRGWLKSHNLLKYFDYVNESPAQPEGSSDKLNAVAMVDDRGWNYDGDWKRTLNGLLESGILEKHMKVSITSTQQPVVKKFKGQRLESPDEETSVWIMTTGDLDRDGETVDPEGLDFSQFDLNPCFLDNHQTDGQVTKVILGRVEQHWLDEVGEGTKWPQVGGKPRKAQLARVRWNLSTESGREAAKMSKDNMLNGSSISFVPKVSPTKNKEGGNHYPEVLVLEYTAAPVGSNPSAIRLKRLGQGIDFAGPYATKEEAEVVAKSINRRLVGA